MQVCLNGHVITDRFHLSPLARKKFCTQCGEKTVTNCQNTDCNTSISGDIDYENAVSFLGMASSAPKIYAECGKKFPWFSSQVSKEEKERNAHFAKKGQEEQEKLKQMGKINVTVGSQGNVVSLGDIHDSVIANVIKLNKAGGSKVADSLVALTKAVEDSSELTHSTKTNYLEQLNTLNQEALKPVEKRLPSAVLKPIIDFGLGTLPGAGNLAKVWETWRSNTKHFSHVI